MSIFVLGYKMTLLEKHARLQIRKWNLEARMDTDTMLNKKAARGRRFSWACQQCEVRLIRVVVTRAASLLTELLVQGAAARHGTGKCCRRTTYFTGHRQMLPVPAGALCRYRWYSAGMVV